MKPTDSKSLLQFIFDQMDKLNRKEIGCQEAQAQAKLAREANNVLNYEIKRAEILMRLKPFGIELRDIEIKSIGEGTNKKQDNPYSIIEEINNEK